MISLFEYLFLVSEVMAVTHKAWLVYLNSSSPHNLEMCETYVSNKLWPTGVDPYQCCILGLAGKSLNFGVCHKLSHSGLRLYK